MKSMEATTTESSPYLTVAQAAKYTNLDRTTLWRARREGRLKTSGYRRAVRFHVRDLDAFMRGSGEGTADN